MHILCPRLAGKFEHLKELFEMEILLIGNYVKALVEVVGSLAVISRRQITGSVKGSAVLFDKQTRGHILKFNHLRTLAFFKQTLVLQAVKHGSHFVVVESLAVIAVKRYFKSVKHTVYLFQGNFLKPVVKLDCLAVAVLDFLKPSPCLVVQSRVDFGLLVVFNVDFMQSLYAVCVNLVLVAPKFESNDHFTKLSTPVAQVVYTNHVIAQSLVDTV